MSIPQKGVVHGTLMAGQWDNLIFYRGQNYHVHLMGEFYANMIIQKGSDDMYLFNTVVHGKNMLVDVNTFARALMLGLHTPSQPRFNIYESFLFKRKNMSCLLDSFATLMCLLVCLRKNML